MDSNIITFIRATSKCTEKLRSIANQSEAHWGYDEGFMETFDRIFNITSGFIEKNPVYILLDRKEPVAFWGLCSEQGCLELEYFYVAESELGKGYGKQLWNHMVRWCEEHDIQKIHFVTSTQAIGFYEKMGAIQDKTTDSMIDGRKIPHFVYERNF